MRLIINMLCRNEVETIFITLIDILSQVKSFDIVGWLTIVDGSIDEVGVATEKYMVNFSKNEWITSGKVVIASDEDGFKQVVESYALLFKNGESVEFVSSIKSLENDCHYQEITEKSIIRSNDFDINLLAKQYLSIYKKLQEYGCIE